MQIQAHNINIKFKNTRMMRSMAEIKNELIKSGFKNFPIEIIENFLTPHKIMS